MCFGPKAPDDAGSACPGPGGIPCSLDTIAKNSPKASSCDPSEGCEKGAFEPFNFDGENAGDQDSALKDQLEKNGGGADFTPLPGNGAEGRDGDYDVEGGGGVGTQSFDGGGDSSLKPREKSYNQMTPDEKDAYRKSLLALRESVYDPSDPGPSGKRIWQVREEAEAAMATRTGFLSALLQAVGLQHSGEEALVMTASPGDSLDDGAAAEMNTYDGSAKNRKPLRVEERQDGAFGTKQVVLTHPTER